MEIVDFIQIIRRKWQTLTVVCGLVMGLTFVLSLAMPAKFRSTTKLLVLQNLASDVDPYTVSKSTEFISGIFAEVIHSEAFFKQVLASEFDITDDYSRNPLKRQKQWKNTVKASSSAFSGILQIDVYHKSYAQAEKLASAVAEVLIKQNQFYHGRGSAIEVKTIDAPATTDMPVTPNVPVNMAVSLILGLILGFGLIFAFPELNIVFWVPSKKEEALEYVSETPAQTFDMALPVEVKSVTENVPDVKVESVIAHGDIPESRETPTPSENSDSKSSENDSVMVSAFDSKASAPDFYAQYRDHQDSRDSFSFFSDL